LLWKYGLEGVGIGLVTRNSSFEQDLEKRDFLKRNNSGIADREKSVKTLEQGESVPERTTRKFSTAKDILSLQYSRSLRVRPLKRAKLSWHTMSEIRSQMFLQSWMILAPPSSIMAGREWLSVLWEKHSLTSGKKCGSKKFLKIRLQDESLLV
jgi:hypothetical protein